MGVFFIVEKGGLPDPHGPLAKTGPPSSIASEFKLIWESLLAYLIVKKGESYAKYAPEQKAKRAAEHGVVASYHHFYLKGT